MRWMRLLASLVALPIAARVGGAQVATGRITGVVTATTAGQPLANVNVSVVGTRLGAQTGPDGRFTIGTVAPGTVHVRAARLGYGARVDTVTVAAGQTATLNFGLAQVSVTLDQVVVVGYGTQRRSDLTGAVASVTPHVEREPIVSLEQTLQGTAPGVQVTTASSAPGGGISMRIRGGSSVFGNNEPLYVIDGFPIENDPNNSSPTSGGRDPSTTVPSNPLAALSPNDIAAIEILKDASATSIYGARGANGVVIITTKRGAPGRPRFTIDTYTGSQVTAKKYDLLSPREFVDFANAWAQGQPTPSTPFPNADSVVAAGSTNWQDQIFRPAPMGSLQMTLTGGSAGANPTRYSLSGGVLQQQGIVRGSDFKRVSMRGNLDQAVGARLHLASNVMVSRVGTSSVPTDGSLNSGAGTVGAALAYIPILPVRHADGTYSLMSTDYPAALEELGLTGGNVPNPVATALDVHDRLGDTRVLANASGDYKLLSGLTFKINVGADLSDRTRDTYYPRTTLQGQALNGRAIRGDLANTSWLTEYTLNYSTTFGRSYLQAVGGYTRQSQAGVRQSMDNSGFVSDITGYENVGAGTREGGPSISSGRTRWTLASYLGRLNYTLLDRYLFTVTGREDGSSRFGANNRWGFFPSAAIGWRLSEEPFMRRFTSIDQLKLRASYGVAGNPSIQPYQSLLHLTSTSYGFGDRITAGYIPSTLGNANLTWESTKQADYGLDLGLWHDRLGFSADYYDKRTDNLLLAKALPTQSGFAAAYVNAGAISNKGLELGLTLQMLRGDDQTGALAWTSTVSWARNQNRVLSLGGEDRLFATSINGDIKASGSLVQVGQPIGVFYGYRTAGIFRDSTTLLAWQARTRMGAGTKPGLGNSIFVDVNGDGVINAEDRTIIGNPNPDWTGGWQNTISWKGFQVSSLLDASHGAQLFNLNMYRLEGASPSTNVLRDRYYNAWSPTNPNGKYNRIGAGVGFLGSDFTDELIEDGSFVRLRTVSLSREIPSRWLRGALGGARVYVTGQNLHTWTKYSGFSPDVSSLGVGNTNRGVDVGAYPMARTVIFGANLTY